MKPKPKFLSPPYGRVFEDKSVAEVYRKRPPYPAETALFIAGLCPAGNRSVLDLGAGTGEVAIPLAPLVTGVDAVDASAAMLAVSRSIPGADNPAIRWFNSTAEDFHYPREYGLIVCAQCLGWMDWRVVFPKMQACLDSRGYLVLVAQDELTNPAWRGALKKLIAQFSTNQDFAPFDLVTGLVERHLFDLAGSWQTPPMTFSQSIDDFVDSIHARNGFSRDQMDKPAAAAFDDAVRALLTKHHPDGMLRGEIRARVTWGKPLNPVVR